MSRMKINPYENHPENKFKKSKRKRLTNSKISAIIQKEIETIKEKGTPTWGYQANQVIVLLKRIEESILNDED